MSSRTPMHCLMSSKLSCIVWCLQNSHALLCVFRTLMHYLVSSELSCIVWCLQNSHALLGVFRTLMHCLMSSELSCIAWCLQNSHSLLDIFRTLIHCLVSSELSFIAWCLQNSHTLLGVFRTLMHCLMSSELSCIVWIVHSSHAITADVNIVEMAQAAKFFLADGVIVTGPATGQVASVKEVRGQWVEGQSLFPVQQCLWHIIIICHKQSAVHEILHMRTRRHTRIISQPLTSTSLST